MARISSVAVLDIGTNSVIMTLAKCSRNGEILSSKEYIATTMLGENLSANGDLSESAMQRTIEAIAEMFDITQKDKVDDLIVTTSSVVRNAGNKSGFLLECHRVLGTYPQVLSGEEEARFVFKGISTSFKEKEPILLIDIGGCSSEIAYGFRDQLKGSQSIDIGTIQIADMFQLHNKFSKQNVNKARKYIIEKLLSFHSELAVWLQTNTPNVVVSSGTGTTYAAVIKKEYIYNREQVNDTISDINELHLWTKNLAKLTPEERLEVPGLVKERVETLPVGLLILWVILNLFRLNKFSITTYGLREGVLRHYIENGYKL